MGLATKKKGSNQVWSLLEGRITQMLQSKDMNENLQDAILLIKNFAKARKGSAKYWNTVVPRIISNESRIHFRKLINVLQRLDGTMEIGEEEKEFLIRKCVDRLLSAEESFGEYLRHVAYNEYLIPHLTEEDIDQIKFKINDQSEKSKNSQKLLEMMDSLRKIKSAKEEIGM